MGVSYHFPLFQLKSWVFFKQGVWIIVIQIRDATGSQKVHQRNQWQKLLKVHSPLFPVIAQIRQMGMLNHILRFWPEINGFITISLKVYMLLFSGRDQEKPDISNDSPFKLCQISQFILMLFVQVIWNSHKHNYMLITVISMFSSIFFKHITQQCCTNLFGNQLFYA